MIGTQIRVFLIFIVSIIGFSTNTNAQEKEYKKNSIYVSLGTVIFTNQCSFSYERTVHEKGARRIKIKGNFGKYGDNGLDLETGEKIYKNHKSISAVLLLGIFEANIGAALTQYTLSKGDDFDPTLDYSKVNNGNQLYVCAGLRFETDSFLLRVGVSNLELLYLGIGFNF